ncbi:hypothetical protein [Nostoc sp. NMS4]|uniref:hypothetical protein n=1 Tax=Nostoc sp. NMS4 TaxID=2815390 RepID=UPI0026000512|nr:hypothetical protein [Nostoc sp. NMS4]MBN3925136.1 hypothetical protein [Nostoc sp. NMS4]
MKLSILIDSVLIVTSIALLPGIGGAQIATNNSGEPIAISSNNFPAQALNDKGYLNAVESHLTSFGSTNDLSY